MLSAAAKPWKIHQSPLYYLLYEKTVPKEGVSLSEKLLPPLLTMLKNDPEYDFLREEKEFLELLDTGVLHM